MPPAAAGIGVAEPELSGAGAPAKAEAWLTGVTSFKAKLLFRIEW
jgi:hypothetical protein